MENSYQLLSETRVTFSNNRRTRNTYITISLNSTPRIQPYYAARSHPDAFHPLVTRTGWSR